MEWKISLRVIYKFIKNIELVVVDPSKVQTMNSSGEELPPGQIEDLWNVCFDSLVDCNSQNDSHTFESLIYEPGEILFTQDLVESAGYQANSINDELVYKIQTWRNSKKQINNQTVLPKRATNRSSANRPSGSEKMPGKRRCWSLQKRRKKLTLNPWSLASSSSSLVVMSIDWRPLRLLPAGDRFQGPISCLSISGQCYRVIVI